MPTTVEINIWTAFELLGIQSDISQGLYGILFDVAKSKERQQSKEFCSLKSASFESCRRAAVRKPGVDSEMELPPLDRRY
jgi:hypothetical protein